MARGSYPHRKRLCSVLLVLLWGLSAAFHHSLGPFPSTTTTTGVFRRASSTSLTLSGNTDHNDPQPDDDKNEELQLDAWIRGIGQQWPLRPEPSSPQSGSSPSDPENPLATLLNLEALLSLTKLPPESKKSIDNLIESISTILKESSPQLSQWDRWISRSSEQPHPLPSSSSSDNTRFLRQATAQLESLLIDASALVSPGNIQGLIAQAGNLVAMGSNATLSGVADLTKRIANETGFEVTAQDLKEATNLAASIVSVADALRLRPDSEVVAATTKSEPALAGPAVAPKTGAPQPRALFSDFGSALEINASSSVVAQAAAMGALAGAIYESDLSMIHDLNHTVVAKGMTDDVRWMVTDCIASPIAFDEDSATEEPMFVRTITIRGFDASDEQVDRERLLNRICSAAPESMKTIKGVVFHSGLLSIARSIYAQIEQYIEWTAPNHKLVLNGHSVGGSLASLLLMLLTVDRGLDFVTEKVLRVYTFGSPPVVTLTSPKGRSVQQARGAKTPSCDVLETVGLPSTMIYGFVQPWDPVVRLFTEIDALYPLIGDLGEDGVTPYASGPPRSLRPITKRIIEVWEGWPKFRENYRSTGAQQYRSAGVQHILLAEPVRYVADRFFPVNIAVPPIAAFLRISSAELLPALNIVFPLDVFEISYVPQAIRSFVHHFYPAYGAPMMDHVTRLQSSLQEKQRRESRASVASDPMEIDNEDGPCTVYVLQQEDGSSIVVD